MPFKCYDKMHEPPHSVEIRFFKKILKDFDLEIKRNEFVTLLGPSGCGKSTAHNLISGLLKPTAGRIFVGEDDITDLPPENRGVGLVHTN